MGGTTNNQSADVWQRIREIIDSDHASAVKVQMVRDVIPLPFGAAPGEDDGLWLTPDEVAARGWRKSKASVYVAANVYNWRRKMSGRGRGVRYWHEDALRPPLHHRKDTGAPQPATPNPDEPMLPFGSLGGDRTPLREEVLGEGTVNTSPVPTETSPAPHCWPQVETASGVEYDPPAPADRFFYPGPERPLDAQASAGPLGKIDPSPAQVFTELLPAGRRVEKIIHPKVHPGADRRYTPGPVRHITFIKD